MQRKESRIRKLREDIGLSQQDLASLLGVATSTIANWENGRNIVETIDKLTRLCAVLDCTLEDLIAFSASPVTEKEDNKKEAAHERLRKLEELREKYDAGSNKPHRATTL